MSIQSDAVATLLAADATLLATLTGGVHRYNTLPNGVTPDSLPPTAFSGGYLLPIALVAGRSENPFGGGYDHANKYKTVRNVVEVYVGKDSDGNTDSINTAALRIEFLLQGVFVGSGWADCINKIEDIRFADLNNAIFHRVDFAIVRGKYLTS